MSLSQLRIKPYYSVIAHSADFIEFRTGVWNHVSMTLQDETQSGKLYLFISKLDGSRSVKDIALQLEMPQSEAEGIIDHLTEMDLVESESHSAFDYYAERFTPAISSASSETEQRRIKPVILISPGDLGKRMSVLLKSDFSFSVMHHIDETHPLYQRLAEPLQTELHHGLQFETMLSLFDAWRDHFIIVLLPTIHPVFLKRLNRITQALGLPWIHAVADGPYLLIGPLFEPRVTGCYDCFETRVTLNLREHGSYQRYKAALVENKILRASSQPLESVLAGLLSAHLLLEVMNYLLTGFAFTKNQVLAIYLPTMEISFNVFHKVAHCACCGVKVDRDDYQPYFDVQRWLEAPCH